MTPRPALPLMAALTAALLAFGLLALWRMLYPIGDAAILLLVAMLLLIWRGSYRRDMARRITWRRAILRTDSWLLSAFLGRVVAHITSLAAGAVAVIVLADFALTASLPAFGLAGGLAVVTALLLTLVSRMAARHVRASLVLVLASPASVALAGALGTAAFFWLGWQVEPAPALADAPSLSAAIAQAQQALPPRDHPLAWALGLPRSLEAAGWVLAKQGQALVFSPFSLIVLLFYNALIAVALARFIIDVVSAAHDPSDTTTR